MAPILKASERGDLGVVNLLLTRVPQAVKTTDQVGVLLGIAYRCLTSRASNECSRRFTIREKDPARALGTGRFVSIDS